MIAGLVFDYDHRERRFDLVESANFPGDDFLEFVHAVCCDLGDDVVYSVDHVSLFDIAYSLQFFDYRVFGADFGVY